MVSLSLMGHILMVEMSLMQLDDPIVALGNPLYNIFMIFLVIVFFFLLVIVQSFIFGKI